MLMYSIIFASIFHYTIISQAVQWPAPYPIEVRRQCSGATGRIMCNGKPSSLTKIRLYDEDRSVKYMDGADLMEETLSNATGYFTIHGCLLEILDIIPRIDVYHSCNLKPMECPRIRQEYIPYRYIHSPSTEKQFYNFGEIDVTEQSGKENKECILHSENGHFF
ncbi:unnamed protein product [Thelazia callipaeda]|uniref:Transthyretin-like family protein n=1 Tax=Thelazia callipaeda TaxID=103827 RepID=A0A0N5CSX7_THECL|nr:unnamed protein product [Thelazia callipaeda]